MSRNGFVTAAGKNHAVPGHGAGMYLHHIGDGLPGSENDIHAVVSLGAAVTDIGGVVMGGEACPDGNHRIRPRL